MWRQGIQGIIADTRLEFQFLTDLAVFPRVNAVYGRHFTGSPPPARSTIQVAGLPLGAAVEIEAVATRDADQPDGP